ncbi:unnamed protein product, partial [Iphiclides podalirius]
MCKMLLALLASAILSGALFSYLRWLKVKRYWSQRGVKSFPPNPILGNLTFLLRYDMNTWLREIHRRSKSPYVGIWLFWRPALMVNCPKIGQRVLIKDAALFRDKLVTSGSSDPIGKNNLFTVKDPLWSSLRRKLSLVFTSAKLRSLNGLIDMKTKELLQRIDMEMTKQKCVNIRMVFTDYTTDVIGTASLGFGGEATLTGHSLLRTVTKEFMNFSLFRSMSWIIMFFYPEWVEFFKLSAFPKTSIDCLSKIYRSVLAQRGGYENKIAGTRDLLDALIKIKQECMINNEEMSEETLIAQAAVFLQGGFDTTAKILTWSVYELSFNVDVQEKLYNEVLEIQNMEGTDELERLSSAKYLNAVLDETLRKYAPMGWMDRVAAQDYKIDDNLTVPAGMPVYVNAIGIHYDPSIYPDPMRFMPERFLNNESTKLPNWAFGEGPRSCIGRRFALLNLRCALARLILNYEFRPTLDTPDSTKVKFDKKSLFVTASVPLLIEFSRRDLGIEI